MIGLMQCFEAALAPDLRPIRPAVNFDRETIVAVLENMVSTRRGTWFSPEEAAAILAQIDGKPSRQVRHKKRGGIYTIIAERAKTNSDRTIGGGDLVTVYRATNGSVWVRPVSEMNDGRFEDLSSGYPEMADV